MICATPVLLYGTGLLIMFDGYTSAYSTDKLSPVPFLLGLREQEMFTNKLSPKKNERLSKTLRGKL